MVGLACLPTLAAARYCRQFNPRARHPGTDGTAIPLAIPPTVCQPKPRLPAPSQRIDASSVVSVRAGRQPACRRQITVIDAAIFILYYRSGAARPTAAQITHNNTVTVDSGSPEPSLYCRRRSGSRQKRRESSVAVRAAKAPDRHTRQLNRLYSGMLPPSAICHLSAPAVGPADGPAWKNIPPPSHVLDDTQERALRRSPAACLRSAGKFDVPAVFRASTMMYEIARSIAIAPVPQGASARLPGA